MVYDPGCVCSRTWLGWVPGSSLLPVWLFSQEYCHIPQILYNVKLTFFHWPLNFWTEGGKKTLTSTLDCKWMSDVWSSHVIWRHLQHKSGYWQLSHTGFSPLFFQSYQIEIFAWTQCFVPNLDWVTWLLFVECLKVSLRQNSDCENFLVSLLCASPLGLLGVYNPAQLIGTLLWLLPSSWLLILTAPTANLVAPAKQTQKHPPFALLRVETTSSAAGPTSERASR